jgi:hypothetical protein
VFPPPLGGAFGPPYAIGAPWIGLPLTIGATTPFDGGGV